jgi:membrane associated rhomboid family serine protease
LKAYFRELDSSIGQFFTPVVKWLVYLCCGVFLLQLFAPRAIIMYLGASPANTIYRGMVWQLVTYAFVHGGFGHLFFNLLALFFFGKRLEERWGSGTFIRFVFVVIVGSVLTHLLVTLSGGLFGRPAMIYSFIIGISGLVYGVMLVYALYYPNDPVYLYGILPIKVKHLVAIMGLLAFLASSQGSDGVAHLTHLGGLLFGYLFYRFPRFFDRIPLPSFRRRGPQRMRSRWEDI